MIHWFLGVMMFQSELLNYLGLVGDLGDALQITCRYAFNIEDV